MSHCHADLITGQAAALVACHCHVEWVRGHFTWRHGGHLVVTQQSSIWGHLLCQVCCKVSVSHTQASPCLANLSWKKYFLWPKSSAYDWFCATTAQNMSLVAPLQRLRRLSQIIDFTALAERSALPARQILSINECPRCFSLLKAKGR